MIKSLLNFIKGSPKDLPEAPEGYCPNCWGRQEYGGKFLEVVKNNNIDINSENANLGWVQEYADKHLSSIALVEEDGKMVCKKCKLSYRPT